MSDDDTETPAPKKRRRLMQPRQPRAVQEVVSQAGFAPTMEQWAVLMEKLTKNQALDIENAATINAQAMKKALRPENEIAPGVSIFNPAGELKSPRLKPTQIYMLAKYPICDPGNYETTTVTELALLEQLKGGVYKVTKSDGTDVQLMVRQELDAAQKPYKTTLFADGKGLKDDEDKNNWPPLIQILTEIVTGDGPAKSFSRMAERIAQLEAQLAAAAA